MYIDDKKYLMHYGVKGMRWGVRRYQPYPSSGKRKKIKKTAAILASPTGYAAYKGVKKLQKVRKQRYEKSDYARAKKMSDDELRKRVNRINLEQSYVQAMERDRGSYKNATRSVIVKYGLESVGYTTGLAKNKEFKKVAAKKLAKKVLV